MLVWIRLDFISHNIECARLIHRHTQTQKETQTHVQSHTPDFSPTAFINFLWGKLMPQMCKQVIIFYHGLWDSVYVCVSEGLLWLWTQNWNGSSSNHFTASLLYECICVCDIKLLTFIHLVAAFIQSDL